MKKIIFRPLARLLVITMILGCLSGFKVETTEAQGVGISYYIDSINGDDANDGRSEGSPWRSIDKVNATVFQPGDQVLFKADGSWVGTLHPKGSGTEANPIIVDMYGIGAKPHFEGNGAYSAVMLDGQDYWTIRNLEVTNNAAERAVRNGIYISGKTEGITRGIKILDCYVHDVDGENRRSLPAPNNMYFNAAIYINQDGRSTATKHFDNILVEGCIVDNVLTAGMKINQEEDYIVDQYHTNVVFRDSVISKVGTDGIIIQNCVDALVEYILCYDAGYNGNAQDTRLIAGLWVCGTEDVTFQYNEVARTRRFLNDGTAFDTDWGVGGKVIVQYNYTHGNEGGFQLNCAGANFDPDYETTILRYNVSVDDELYIIQKDAEYTHDVYNNVFYKSSGNLYPGDAHKYRFYNNIFYFQSQPNWGWKNLFDHNNYYPAQGHPAHANSTYVDPQLVNPGAIGDGREYADNYKLLPTSPLIDAGMFIEDNGGQDYWGNLVTGKPDIGAHDASAGTPLAIFTDNFNGGTAPDWGFVSGSWSLANGRYRVNSGDGHKTLMKNKEYSYVTYEADVLVRNDTSYSDAGLVFRATADDNIIDGFKGYSAVLSADRDIVNLGIHNNGWTSVAVAPIQLEKDTLYRLKVVANGGNIQVYVDDELLIDVNEFTFLNGYVGLRTYRTDAEFDNVRVFEN